MKKFLPFLSMILFSVITLSLNITILSPQDGAKEVDIRTSLRWQTIDTEGKELRYKIYVSEDEDIDEKDLKLENIFSNFYTGDVLKPETTYYWKVEGVDQDGNVYSSNIATFTTRSLRSGDAYIIFFEDFNKLIPVNNNFLGVLDKEIILLDEEKKVIESKRFQNKIEDVLSTQEYIVVTTDNDSYILDYQLNERSKIDDKVKGIAGKNVLYSNNKIYLLNYDASIFEEVELENIVKSIVKEGDLFVLTEKTFHKMNNNLEIVKSFSLNDNAYDFEYLEYENQRIFIILTNQKLFLLDSNLNKIAERTFQIETQRYNRSVYSYYDKIVLLSGSRNLYFYDENLDLVKSFTYEENFDYFVPINEEHFALVGESIKSFDTEGNLIWNYSTINKFQIITEPIVYDKGLVVGIKDFITRFIVLYDSFDTQYFLTRYLEEKITLPEIAEEVFEPIEETIPSTPATITIEATEITPQPTEIIMPELEEEITLPSTPATITIEATEIIMPELEEEITLPSTPVTITIEATEITPQPTEIIMPELEEEITLPSTPATITIEATEIEKIIKKDNNEYIYGATYDGEEFIYLYGYEDKGVWDAKSWKLDLNGNVVLEKTLYADKTDFFRDGIITTDASENTKNTVFVGDTLSYGLNGNVYLVSISEAGTINYQINYGDIGRDSGISIINIDENSFAISGNLFVNKKLSDIFVSKYLNDGTRIWTNNFGGNDVEIAVDIKNTQDQGFMVFGATRSFGAGGFDIYVLKIDYYGNMKWSNVYGDPNDNIPIGVVKEGRKYYVLYENSSNPKTYGILEVDEINGFGDSFETQLEGEPKFLGFTTIENRYLAYGYTIKSNKKAGVVYEINIKEKTFEKVYSYELENGFEIVSLIKPENQDNIYIFGNTVSNGKQNIALKVIPWETLF